LSAALETQPGTFSGFYVNMVRAGEAGGALEAALARLSEFMERSRELRESVTSALIYPVILLVVALLSVMLILTFVVPRFASMFQEAGESLPLPTLVVMTVGQFVERYWWVLGLITAGVYLYLRRELSDPVRRGRWHGWLLMLPLVGDLVAKLEVARFTRILGTLLSNGVPLLNAIAIAREIIKNDIIGHGVARVEESVREGQGLAGPLIRENIFPHLATQMLKVGEETGNLEGMLLELADIYEREVKNTVQRLVALIEPVLILGLGLVIAGIIMSLLVAILRVNDLTL
jgi:general secretion pathway protein F